MILMIQNDPHREETIYQNGRYRIIKVVGRSTSGRSSNNSESGRGRFEQKSFFCLPNLAPYFSFLQKRQLGFFNDNYLQPPYAAGRVAPPQETF